MSFEREQKEYRIGSVKVGGQPGEFPTVLIGSIFYQGHKVVRDERKGSFDRQRAEELVKKQEEYSDRTNNPHMVDIVSTSPGAIERYIDFVAGVTDAPFFVDSTLPEVRIAGIRGAREMGLVDRVVYNSITYHVDRKEIQALKENGVKSAVILGYNPRNIWPRGRVELLRGTESNRGLLEAAKESGVQNILVDVAVLDVPGIGLALDSVKLVKAELGLPSGGGPSNAVLEWKKVDLLSPYAKTVCVGSAVTAMQHAGADFILYGPISKASIAFPAAAMTDAIIAYAARHRGVAQKTRDHPLYKIF